MTPTPRWPGPGQRWPPLVRTTQSLSSRETYAAARLYASASALAAFASPAAWAARSANHRPSGHHAASGRTAVASSAHSPAASANVHLRSPARTIGHFSPSCGGIRVQAANASPVAMLRNVAADNPASANTATLGTAQSGTNQMFSTCLGHPLQRRDHAVGAYHHDSASRPRLLSADAMRRRRDHLGRLLILWWAHQDSNLEPRDYESPALTD